MARPRVFISSTYFDLRAVRADLERFIREIGYDPVLFEKGHVAYEKDSPLEDYCYREISNCDIVITIIGGKFGTQSRDDKNSITQNELKTAIKLGKQIYLFVERGVHAEYRTYLENKNLKGFKPAAVNDGRVYGFLEEIYALPAGNPIEPFELPDDIVRYLREQWAGLFQRLLQSTSRRNEMDLLQNLNSTAATLKQLVTFLTDERSKGDQAIKDILLSSHPAFAAIRSAVGAKFRVFFSNFEELDQLMDSCGLAFDDVNGSSDYIDWDHHQDGYYVRVSSVIFDEDNRLLQPLRGVVQQHIRPRLRVGVVSGVAHDPGFAENSVHKQLLAGCRGPRPRTARRRQHDVPRSHGLEGSPAAQGLGAGRLD